jgi:23S rRNA pseudouridine1911/1915/1917 synthase
VNVVPVEVVYSDDAIVVVNKPAGLTTSRSAEEKAEFGRGKKYLPTTLAELLPAALGTPNRPVFAVHRLDRDTTGLIVFARTPAAARHLTAQFRKRTVDRRYLALTRGIPPEGRIESRLVDDRGDGRRGSGDGGDSQRAVTQVRVVERLGAFAVVECKLDTGRTHQVRIHLGEAGTPLCGERLYDRPLNGTPLPDESGAARPMLHAARLGIEHPEGDEFMGWEADPPADFEAVLARLRTISAGKTAEPAPPVPG